MKAIIVSGNICSGKTTLASQLSGIYKIPIASFGGYLSDYSKHNFLPTDRKSLQDLGESFIKNQPEYFLNEVIKHSSVNGVLIFEGVRHEIIFQLIMKLYDSVFTIYLDVIYEIRLRRFLKRNKESDTNNTEQEFLKMNDHMVEKELGLIKVRSDIIVGNYNEILQHALDQFIKPTNL